MIEYHKENLVDYFIQGNDRAPNQIEKEGVVGETLVSLLSNNYFLENILHDFIAEF